VFFEQGLPHYKSIEGQHKKKSELIS